MMESVKLGLYIKEHKADFDKIMTELFAHFNKLGEVDPSGKIQLVYLSTMLNLFLTKSGIPKDKQMEVAKALLESIKI